MAEERPPRSFITAAEVVMTGMATRFSGILGDRLQQREERLQQREARRRRKERRLTEPDSVDPDFVLFRSIECEMEALTPAAERWMARAVLDWNREDDTGEEPFTIDRDNARLVRFLRRDVKWDELLAILVRDEGFKVVIRGAGRLGGGERDEDAWRTHPRVKAVIQEIQGERWAAGVRSLRLRCSCGGNLEPFDPQHGRVRCRSCGEESQVLI